LISSTDAPRATPNRWYKSPLDIVIVRHSGTGLNVQRFIKAK